MADVDGVCDQRFEAVRSALARNLDSGEELDASLVLDIDGDIVIDMWGGFRDQARTVPWSRDTITNVWSSTKTVTSLAALMLVDRGELDVDAPVAKYWPEFAASGYHALNFGHLIGEVVRRTSGQTLKQFVAEEIAGPLGADFQIGAAVSDWGRIADVVPPSPLRYGIGYGLPQLDTLPWIPDDKICFRGGSMIVMDVGRRMTISYMMNKMGPGIVGSDRSAESERPSSTPSAASRDPALR